MKINEINLLENPENGLKAVKMKKLKQIVVIAGKNGSGKTRLLQSIQNELNNVPKLSEMNRANDEIIRLENEIKSMKGTMKNELISLKHIKEVGERRVSPDPMRINAENNVRNYKNAITNKRRELRKWKNITKYSMIQMNEYNEKYEFLNFIPNGIELKDYGAIIENHQNKYFEEVQKNGMNFIGFNERVLSIIKIIVDQYIKSTHNEIQEDSSIVNANKILFAKLNGYIKLFLGKEVKFDSKTPTLFGRPLGHAKLSAGQSILLQLCVALCFQDSNIEQTIIFMDEPENHLHPKALLELIDKIIKAIPKGQLWISTHSIHVLSHVDPEEIWYMENSSVSHYGKSSLEVLSGLVGDNDKIEKMLNFMSLPAVMASNKFAYECLFEPETVSSTSDDPQVKQIMRIIKNEKNRVLDFGSGQGRLLAAIYEVCINNGKEINQVIDYYAFDIKENKNCKEIISNIYGNENRYLIGDNIINAIDENFKESVDIVIMCNVFHEIDPIYWEEIFKKNGYLTQILKQDGSLLIVEDQKIPYGEKAYSNGFILFDEEEFRTLFNIGNDNGYIVDDYYKDIQDKVGRLKAHLIEKKHLNVSKITIQDALTAQYNKAKMKIVELRKIKEPSFKEGQLHGLWTQQLANCTLALNK